MLDAVAIRRCWRTTGVEGRRWRMVVSWAYMSDVPFRLTQVYISHRMRRKAATEPKTIPTTVPGGGPLFMPE